MLKLIEKRRNVRSAQGEFVKAIRRAWPQREGRWIVWRPNKAFLTTAHDNVYWFATGELDDAPIPKFWNSFGSYTGSGNLTIAVEINSPTESPSGRIAGLFAKDEYGRRYVMHDGSVGGGKRGVGRESFLRFLQEPLIEVRDSGGEIRKAIVVAAIDDADIGTKLGRFVQRVLDFKQAIASGAFDADEKGQDYGDYFKEFSGKKRRRAQAEYEYLTRHGDIIEALRKWRKLKKGEREVKSLLIDWGVRKENKLLELYEVKTSCDRQGLYTAIGQLLVYARKNWNSCKRFLVLPESEKIPNDIVYTITKLKIEVLRYKLSKTSAEVAAT